MYSYNNIGNGLSLHSRHDEIILDKFKMTYGPKNKFFFSIYMKYNYFLTFISYKYKSDYSVYLTQLIY